jgi:hypothetical protein
MSFDLFLRFTGLCAFVATPSRSAVRVVLVNARDHSHGQNHEPHHAALLVPERHWDGTLRQPNFIFDDKARNEARMCAFLLEAEDFVVDPPGTGIVLEPGPADTAECPVSNTTGYLWISEVKKAGAGPMHSDMLTKKKLENTIARFRFTSGTFKTDAFRRVSPISRDIIKWKLGDIKRSLAEEVLLFRDDLAGGGIALKGTDFSGGTSTISLREKSGRLEAWIVNMPLLDILGARKSDPFSPDHHFLHFHRLATSAGSMIPVPLSEVCSGGVGSLSNPKCPPARFEDNPDA